MRHVKHPGQKGSILVAILIIMPFFMLITISSLQMATNGFRVARADQFRTHAQLATDAGIDYAIEQINLAVDWPGTGSEVVMRADDGGGETRFIVTVDPIDSRHKTIVSEGRYYRTATSGTPESSVKINVTVRGVESGGFSIVSGVGGLIMRNSSKIVGGNVYVNGTINMATPGTTSQIGQTIKPVDVKVAHQACPLPSDPNFNAEYPRLCASGENGEPITIGGSAHIYGEVKANNQTTGTNMTDSGLCPESNIFCTDYPVPVVTLPEYDRVGQIALATPPVAPYNTNWSCNSGSVTWPANLKIDGDVTISNTCQITVEGNVWITGNVIMRNSSSKLIVKEGLTVPPVIMIDGASGLNMRNSSELKSNSTSVGFRVITYASAAACSPNCASVTGTDLYNSRSLITIDMDQSASGPNTEFYARWSKLTAGNNGSLGALVAQTVELKNSLAVTFGAQVTGTSEVTWIVDDYRRVFD